jgi:hypothetical protein
MVDPRRFSATSIALISSYVAAAPLMPSPVMTTRVPPVIGPPAGTRVNMRCR